MRPLPAVLLLVLVGVLVGAASAEVLVFDKYDTVTHVEGNTIRIEREMTLTNVARNPVIPGELHFKLYQQDGTARKSIQVSDFTAMNAQSQKLATKIVTNPDETDLSVTVWEPMLPGFSYTFRVSYVMTFGPSGLLFYELKIPREDTTIPIKASTQTVLLQPQYHVTYAPDTAISQLSGNTVVSWAGQSDSQVIEYSSLPLPRIQLGSLSLKAVNIFWGVIIACLIGLFAVSLRRQQRIKEERELKELENQHHHLQHHEGEHGEQPPQGPSGG